VRSALKGLRESTTQGWRRKTPPTLGSVMLPFQSSLRYTRPNFDKFDSLPALYASIFSGLKGR